LAQLAAELQEQTRETAAWDARLRAQSAELTARAAALTQEETRLHQQQGEVETVQLALALAHQRLDQSRRRLEQREEHLAQEQMRLQERGTALDACAASLHEEQQRLRAERAAWAAEQQARAAQQAQWEEAAARLGELESQFTQSEAEWTRRRQELDEQTRTLHESSRRLRERWRKLLEIRRSWRLERQQWLSTAQELAEAEVARQSLQEQLRRRAIDLQEREQRLTKREAQLQAAQERVAQEQQELARQQAELAEGMAATAAAAQEQQTQFNQRAAMLEEQAAAVAQARADLVRQQQEQARAAAELAEQRAAFTAQAGAVLEQVEVQRQRLPELLAQAQAGLGLLNQARAQLRLHLDEIHQYVHKSQALLSDAQRDLAAGQEGLRQQRAALLRQQAEHRHEVSAFKLFLGEWQERLEEFRQHLLREQSAVAERAAALAAQHAELDRNAAALNQRESQVAEQEAEVLFRRAEINRHLQDLQRWYRQKMRELADRHLLQPETEEPTAPGLRLVVAEDADQDERLATSLLDLELVDAATLAELRSRARSERCSLGRLLLDGELLTPWQLQTILAGRLSDLVIGELRVLDVVRTTTWETLRQVYDPQRGVALLRSLLPHVERGRQAEYRAGFTAAMQVASEHVAATFEVFDLAGMPAVLQEWVIGLPATAWRELARVPAVWLRLVEQAALGLAAIHAAGLVHGRLQEGQFLLDATGRLRLCGLGEPAWLETAPPSTAAHSAWDDLQHLGRIAAAWLTAPSSSRLGRAHQSPLEAVVQALLQPSPGGKVTNAAELAEQVRGLRRRAADDELAWQRLLAFLHERLHGAADAARPRHAA
jgi:chromosome segregation ATPase